MPCLTPRVTVLLSVHNDGAWLPAALSSILTQTFADFELLAIDDGSTDATPRLLADAARADGRVRVVTNPVRIGLTRSLNRGLDLCRGAFVARMDADDIALPDRLARQVEFLAAHPDVAIVGSARSLINERGEPVAFAPAPASDRDIRWKCLLGNPFAHPTVMLRRATLQAGALRYDESFATAQDYELWIRLLARSRGANIPEPLLKYRLRRGISRVNRVDQLANHDRLVQKALRALLPGFIISSDEARELRGRFGGHSVREPAMNPADPAWAGLFQAMRDCFDCAYGGLPTMA